MTILFLFKDSEEALKKEYITDEEKESWNTLVFPESVSRRMLHSCYINILRKKGSDTFSDMRSYILI